MITIDDFENVDMRVGTIISACLNEKAKKPAYKLTIDFGDEIGIKTSSAQITVLYTAEQLVGLQIIAVVNFPPRQVAGVKSEVLILGSLSKQGTVLLHPLETVANGDRIS
ncbi:MAG: tRNA-binding protein [Desulfovibrio sp.]|jgi:tRNA-binding protein|nr:tRNA-binding protein [Desulfovibrio sp.]